MIMIETYLKYKNLDINAWQRPSGFKKFAATEWQQHKIYTVITASVNLQDEIAANTDVCLKKKLQE